MAFEHDFTRQDQRPPLRLTVRGASDTGLFRQQNEDRFLVDRELGLAAVADGMGGHVSGEMASAEALACVQDYLQQAQQRSGQGLPLPVLPTADPDATLIDEQLRHSALLMSAIDAANASLYRENQTHGRRDGTGMGTTLTGFRQLPGADAFALFHVGDSRLYRYRGGELEQLTRDQTAYQLALESGTLAQLPPHNLLLQAVGPTTSVVPELQFHSLRQGDVLLLCSDGLHGWVPHADIALSLQQVAEAGPEPVCANLIALAKQHGSRDNITVLVALWESTDPPANPRTIEKNQ